MIEDVIDNTVDPAVAVLALEGLCRIEGNVAGGQFRELPKQKIKELLRKWRCESPMYQRYSEAFGRVPRVLRSLTIFKTLEVPLFIDDHGKKELLSSYESRIEDIDIDGETPIYHVTHSEEAKKIIEEQRLKPSNNKNILEGCWFGQLDNSCSSVYGSHAFETTLSRLGIKSLNQGEIVSYKREVNVILYAADDGKAGLSGLKKPKLTVEDVARGKYVNVSIFVPSSFLPNTVDFHQVVSEPIKVEHGGFCVKEKRPQGRFNCTELELCFRSYDSNSKMVDNLIDNTVDAAVAVLALEGLYRIEGNVNGGQFSDFPRKKIKELLRKWRCESPMPYWGAYGRVPLVLRGLTIFATFEVPLFIDDYGEKELLSSDESRIEDIDIDGETPIYHVTHSEEAKKIIEEQRLKPSNNKNILEGCWFGQLDNSCSSVYGSHAFETTLSRLGIKSLNQGEIVSYKREVNVILYAADDGKAGLSGLKKPKLTVEDVARGKYVNVSIFVPSSFLPNTVDFHQVVSEPIKVKHRGFCVKEKRSQRRFNCTELELC